MRPEFPDGFLWGAAGAGHQIEGGNVNSDSWAAEWSPGTYYAEPSGDACDSYHRYGDDIALLAGAGLNAYRFSVEWARIEPEEGWFSRAELEHYRRVLGRCHERGITPVVTYNHFTTPLWFAERGGWAHDAAAQRFARYCEQVTAHLGDLIPWACTLNEPNLLATLEHIGIAPVGSDERLAAPGPSRGEPAQIDALRAASLRRMPTTLPGFQAVPLDTIAQVHRMAVDAIRSGPGDQRVGWTLALVDVQAAPGGEHRAERARQRAQLEWLDVSASDDFVGVQTYSRELIGPDGIQSRTPGVRTMLTGWELYPEALGHTVRLAAERSGVPVLVTENGCATDDDDERIEYTESALQGLAGCVRDGVDVAGYLHWSVLDNFEWASGFGVRFGLIAVDPVDFTRSPKRSLSWLGEVARRGGLP